MTSLRLPKSITSRNMITREDFIELERRLGGPVAAAESAGVKYPTWYRYREGLLSLTPSKQKLIAMMLQTSRLPLGQ